MLLETLIKLFHDLSNTLQCPVLLIDRSSLDLWMLSLSQLSGVLIGNQSIHLPKHSKQIVQCLDLQPVFLPKCSRFVQRGHPIQPPQHFQPYSVSMALQESCRSIHRGSQIRGPISALWNSIQFMTRIIIYSDDHAVTNSIWSC